MKINKVAFGNLEEAFIEERLTDGVNIIYSNDNNKGKTLVMQGIMYSIGNEPIFPSGFDYENYFFYTSININKTVYEFLRKKNTYIIKNNDILQICDSSAEFKYYINKNILNVPRIIKKEKEKLVDLELFYQLFFIGQDRRNTSNIINNGYYNKQDFIEMLCYLNGYPVIKTEEEDKDEIKKEVSKLNEDIKTIKKLMKFTKDNPNISKLVSKSSDRDVLEEKRKIISEINRNITEYKKKRNREVDRNSKLENLILELNSLNRNIEQGKVICGECGSDKVIFSNKDINFEVSNKVVRNQILDSIRESIQMKEDIILEYTKNINIEQDKINKQLRETPIEIQKLLIYSEDILSYEEYDNKVLKLMEKIDELNSSIINVNIKSTESKDKKKEMINDIVNMMNANYKKIDQMGNIIFDDIFTKKDETYSGSEEQEFYYCKVIALNDYFKYDFPILIDSFRDGEISSQKEQVMIEGFKKLGKQVILTSTLKQEEYDKLKYDELADIKAIDYSKNIDSKILQNKYAFEFKKILEEFNVYS